MGLGRAEHPAAPSSGPAHGPAHHERHHPTTPATHHRGRRERQLLPALGAEHRPPAGLGAGHVGLLVGVPGLPAGRPSAGRWPPATGSVVYGSRPGGIGPRWKRQRTAASRAGRAARGRRSRGAAPLSARTTSPAIQPSGATLQGPSSRTRRTRSTAVARSSRWRNWRGRLLLQRPACRWRRRATGPARLDPSRRQGGARPQHGRPCAPGQPAAQSATSMLDVGPLRRRRATSAFGRSGASSVSGTGLLGHAP